MKIFRFHFKTPVHIGSVRSDYDESEPMIHSDTIYAAIMQAWVTLGLGEHVPAAANDRMDFAVSSLFPFTTDKDGRIVYFLPRLHKKLQADASLDGKDKQIKEVEWLDLDYFSKQVQATGVTVEATALKGKYLTDQAIDESFIMRKLMQHVNLRSEGQPPANTETDEEAIRDARPFYMERLYFRKGSGFYLLFVGNDEQEKKVRTALRFLGDEGIGTDRHIGNGAYELQEPGQEDEKNAGRWKTLQQWAAQKTAYATNLSLFCPSTQPQLKAMLDDKARYETLKRGGWITTEPRMDERKQSIYMFREGSVFGFPTATETVEGWTTAGKTVNLRPVHLREQMHPVWRVGKSIFIPVHL